MPRSTPRDSNAIRSAGRYHIVCRGADGGVKWTDVADNALMNEGEQSILDVYLRNGTAPTNFFVGFMATTLASAPAETSTLADLTSYEMANATEPGYTARKQINRDSSSDGWPTLALDSGDFMATGKTVSWTATGNWTKTLRWVFLTTVVTAGETTGKLLSLAQLSVDKTVSNGDVLEITYTLKLQ